jgi:hypothetical protein
VTEFPILSSANDHRHCILSDDATPFFWRETTSASMAGIPGRLRTCTNPQATHTTPFVHKNLNIRLAAGVIDHGSRHFVPPSQTVTQRPSHSRDAKLGQRNQEIMDMLKLHSLTYPLHHRISKLPRAISTRMRRWLTVVSAQKLLWELKKSKRML